MRMKDTPGRPRCMPAVQRQRDEQAEEELQHHAGDDEDAA